MISDLVNEMWKSYTESKAKKNKLSRTFEMSKWLKLVSFIFCYRNVSAHFMSFAVSDSSLVFFLFESNFHGLYLDKALWHDSIFRNASSHFFYTFERLDSAYLSERHLYEKITQWNKKPVFNVLIAAKL